MNNTRKPALNLAEQTTYLNKDIDYLKNISIIEWDIHAAGFSVIKYKKLLPTDMIATLESMDKKERNIKIGIQIKSHPNIGKEILLTLTQARKAFVLVNEIYNEDILTIKKDAIFLIKKRPTITKFKEYFEFMEKSTYTSYMYINKQEFYYNSYDDVLEVKGLGEEKESLQHDYFLNDIRKIIKSGERLDSTDLFKYLVRYRSKYLNRELPKETYRNLKTGYYEIGNYSLEEIDDELFKQIDISQNYMNYLVPIFNSML